MNFLVFKKAYQFTNYENYHLRFNTLRINTYSNCASSSLTRIFKSLNIFSYNLQRHLILPIIDTCSRVAPYKNFNQNILYIHQSYILLKKTATAITLCKISSLRWAIFSVLSSTVCCRESFSLSMALMVALS